jgi:hypothetical protein
MRHALIAVGILAFGATACAPAASPAPSTTVPAFTATTASPSAPPSVSATPTPRASTQAGERPGLPAGAPTIADPYWLAASGTSSYTGTDEHGTVVETTTRQEYQVINGGSIVDRVLVNGTEAGLLSVRTTTGDERIPGLSPIEEQYGSQIDNDLPSAKVMKALYGKKDPWTRTEQTRGGRTIYVRSWGAADGAMADAFWTTDEPGVWCSLFFQGDEADGMDAVLTALLGPTSE